MLMQDRKNESSPLGMMIQSFETLEGPCGYTVPPFQPLTTPPFEMTVQVDCSLKQLV